MIKRNCLSTNHIRMTPVRFFMLASISFAFIIIVLGKQISGIQAYTGPDTALVYTSTPTRRPEKPYVYKTISRMCGQLVFLIDQDTGYGRTGLRPCGQGGIYLFEKHPRDMVPFYQFRDIEIRKGGEIINTQYGSINTYIIGFKNYVGIANCSECGLYGVEPTWTLAPLTPYTPTPRPPTSTPYIPSPTSTETPTLAPYQITETSSMFELLFGTEIQTQTASETPSPIPTKTLPNPEVHKTSQPTGSPFQSPLVLGIGILFVMIGLAYMIWISLMRSRKG